MDNPTYVLSNSAQQYGVAVLGGFFGFVWSVCFFIFVFLIVIEEGCGI